MTRPQPLFEIDAQPSSADLVTAATQTIAALREQHAIQAWHELDCAIVLAAAEGVGASRGIAKSQMLGQLLAARAKLPEPIVEESADVVTYEADRDLEWLRAHTPDIPNRSQPASI